MGSIVDKKVIISKVIKKLGGGAPKVPQKLLNGVMGEVETTLLKLLKDRLKHKNRKHKDYTLKVFKIDPKDVPYQKNENKKNEIRLIFEEVDVEKEHASGMFDPESNSLTVYYGIEDEITKEIENQKNIDLTKYIRDTYKNTIKHELIHFMQFNYGIGLDKKPRQEVLDIKDKKIIKKIDDVIKDRNWWNKKEDKKKIEDIAKKIQPDMTTKELERNYALYLSTDVERKAWVHSLTEEYKKYIKDLEMHHYRKYVKNNGGSLLIYKDISSKFKSSLISKFVKEHYIFDILGKYEKGVYKIMLRDFSVNVNKELKSNMGEFTNYTEKGRESLLKLNVSLIKDQDKKMKRSEVIAKVLKKLAGVKGYAVQTENKEGKVNVYLASSKFQAMDLLEMAEEWSNDPEDTSIEREMHKQAKKVDYDIEVKESFEKKEGKLFYSSKEDSYELINEKAIKV